MPPEKEITQASTGGSDQFAKSGNKLRVLDLADPAVRQAVGAAKDVKGLYERHGLDFSR